MKVVSMAGPRTFAGIIPIVTKEGLGRRGMAFGSLLAEWQSLAGDFLGNNSVPGRLIFPRGRREGAVLHVHAYSAVTLTLQHTAPLVIERINSFFGYPAVAELKISQIQRPVPPGTPPRFRRLSVAETRAIEAAAKTVPDEALARTLTRFGISLASRIRDDTPQAPAPKPCSLTPLEKPRWKL